MKKAVVLLIGICSARFSFSQFNDSTHYLVNYASTGVINKTNQSNSYMFTNALKLAVRKKSITLNNSNSWIYGWQQHNLTNNDFTSSLDFNLYKTLPHFYYWGLANYDKSYSLKINNRLQTGLGVAYNFLDRTTAYVNVSDGLLYETSNLQLNDSTNNIYHTFRNSLRLRYQFIINDIFVLEGTHFWQPSLSYKEDYILKSSSALSVKLKKWLNLTTTATYNKVNRTHKENLLVSFGVTVEKYF